MRRSRFRALVVLTALALTAAACGGDTADEAASPEDTAAIPEAENVDGALKIGTLLPQTGDLGALGPPQQKGVELAVQQINEAGGVLDTDVELAIGDTGTNEQIAASQLDQHLRDNVDALVGTFSSRIALSVIDTVIGAEKVMCSPSNTSRELTDYEDSEPGFYFRTAPPDKFQGPALARTIVGDGFSQVAIIAINDAYGQGLADSLAQTLRDQGASVATNIAYDPSGQDFSADVQRLVDAEPDAVALLGFADTGAQILRGMISQGIGPQDIGVYGADGIKDDTLPSKVNPDDPQAVAGFKGTAPSSEGSEAFTTAYEEFTDPGTQNVFSAQSYDCTNIIALAAVAADTDDPAEFHNEMVPVTRGGEQCSDFAECKSLLDEGTDIDYEGATGVDFVPVGEPDSGTYDIWELSIENGEGVIETVDTITLGATDDGGSPTPSG